MTVIVASAAYFFVTNYPTTAKFLTKKEKDYIYVRLKDDSDATRDEAFTWPNVAQAFKDPKVWLYGLGFHTMSLPLYTLSLFLVRPPILRASVSTSASNPSSPSSPRLSKPWATPPRKPNS